MLRRMTLVKTDVSEKLIASIFRVERMKGEGIKLAVTSNRNTLRSIQEDSILHSQRNENFKSYIRKMLCFMKPFSVTVSSQSWDHPRLVGRAVKVQSPGELRKVNQA
jgi:hypothetical protein